METVFLVVVSAMAVVIFLALLAAGVIPVEFLVWVGLSFIVGVIVYLMFGGDG